MIRALLLASLLFAAGCTARGEATFAAGRALADQAVLGAYETQKRTWCALTYGSLVRQSAINPAIGDEAVRHCGQITTKRFAINPR